MLKTHWTGRVWRHSLEFQHSGGKVQPGLHCEFQTRVTQWDPISKQTKKQNSICMKVLKELTQIVYLFKIYTYTNNIM